MKVDRFTKAVLTGIFLFLVLLTLKEYDIISDAGAAKVVNAGITDVNIKQINGKSLYPHNVMHPSAYFGLPVVIHQPRIGPGGNEYCVPPKVTKSGSALKVYQ